MVLQRYEHQGAAPPTTLNGNISAGATSCILAAGTGYPTGAVGLFVIVIDPGTASEEKILCLSRSTNTVTFNSGGRGYDGTVASSHSNGAVVQHVFAAAEADDDNDHVYTTTRDDHTQYSLVTGTRAFTGGITVSTGGASISGNVAVTGNETVSGTLGVTGATTLSSFTASSTAGITGNTTVGGTMGITGNTTVGGTLGVTGAVTGSSSITGTDFVPSGLTGATATSRWVGATTAGKPASGTFSTDDWIVDNTGTLWVCYSGGTSGSWQPGPGTLISDTFGASGTTNIGPNASGTIMTATAALVSGSKYLVTARCSNIEVVTAAPVYAFVQLTDSASLIAGTAYLWSVGNGVGTGLPATFAGSLSTVITAASTGTVTFTMTGTQNGSSGAIQVDRSSSEITVVRIA